MPESPEKEILNQLFEEKEFEISTDQEPKVSKEVDSLIEKVEKDINLTKPINDEAGQPLVSHSPVLTPPPIIVLPLTKTKYYSKVKQKVENSFLWLREWCGRLIKIFGERSAFSEEKEDGNK